MVAEDNPDNLSLIVRLLARLGYEADTASDGESALNMARDGRVHRLILMDCHMPRMDGYEAARRLRRMGLVIPIIALTANVIDGEREHCQAAGMNDFLGKPITLDTLRTVLDTWIKAGP